MSLPSDAILPPGSLVLVTGVNGYVGSNIADMCVAYGYVVRGTVRDIERSAWMKQYFDDTYGANKFELVTVSDLAAEGSLNQAVKGCAGVIQTASILHFGPEDTDVIPACVSMVTNSLLSATKEATIKRFVFTSSSIAATQNIFDKVYDLSTDHWNDAAVELWKQPPPYGPERWIITYAASKVLAERALHNFVRENKPRFTVNAVLPDSVIGKILNNEKQGYPTSVGAIRALFMNEDGWQFLPSQWAIDASDMGRLHVAALARADAENERIFGFAFEKSWTHYVELLREMYPGRSFPDPPDPDPKCIPNILARPRAEELLRWLGRDGWTGEREFIRKVTDTLV